ncbi:MAG: NTP transferase domain-containing protein [Deltaproteobacteria bacterium]|nr:NTP transferase domain-containing protein [Deltaproteobacteria bacterium]
MSSSPIYALVMAGGAGTRFWPASRRARPKQLLPLVGAQPLLRQSVERLLPLCGWRGILLSTGARLAEPTRAALPELLPEQLLVEPVGRNTAPCIGWGAAVVARSDPEALVMALPSDAYIADAEAFRRAAGLAIEAARGGTITTIGIRPTRAETGYGYIEIAEPWDVAGAFRAARFVEKPSREHAAELVASGKHLWNAGMFFFRAGDMLGAIRRHLPELGRGLERLDAAARLGREPAELAQVFPTLPAISIDHGVMEHLDRLAVVPGDFGWSDVGSWLAASELAPKDARGNSAPPGGVFVDAAGNHVVDLRTAAGAGPARRVIALVGVSGLVVVETDDALLVAASERAQDVRAVVAELQARGDEHLL